MASEAHEYVCDWRLFVLFAERFSLCYKHKEAQGEVPFPDTSSCAALGGSYVFLSYEEQFAILG